MLWHRFIMDHEMLRVHTRGISFAAQKTPHCFPKQCGVFLGLSILTLWKDISTILQSLEAPRGDIFIIFFNVYKNTTVSVMSTVVL